MVLRDYGKPELDPGEWTAFGLDSPENTGIKALRIRRIPQAKIDEYNRKYGREVMIAAPDGSRRPYWEKSFDQTNAWYFALASFALTDCEGVEVEIASEAAEKWWNETLRDHGQTYHVGDRVKLDGKLDNGKVRDYLLRSETQTRAEIMQEDGTKRTVKQDISVFVVGVGLRWQTGYERQKEEEQGNSSSGSASGSISRPPLLSAVPDAR